MMFHIESLAFLLLFSQPGRSDYAKIIETYEYSGGIYRENRTALMTVIYKKTTSFRAQWTLQKTGLGYSEPILLEEEITPKYRTQINGTMNDTVVIKTQLDRSGTYTFRIIDPITNKTVQTANFTLKILAAPRETSIQMVGGGYPRNLQFGQIYNFECSAAGYPLPEIHWDINSCTGEMEGLCEDVWKPLISVNEIRSVESTYYRKQQIGVRADQIGAVRCMANNTEGGDEKQFIVIPSDIVDTEINSGMSISPQTWDKTVVFRGDEFNLTCQVQKYEFKRFLVWSKKEPDGDEIVLARQSGGIVLFRSKLGVRHQLHFDGTSSNFSNKFVLQFINISKAEAGFYRCKTSDYNDKDFIRTVNVTVDDDFKPIINDSSLAPEDIVFSNDSSVTLPCKVNAQPPADVVWYKNGEILNISLNGNIKKTAEWLQFLRAFQTDEGLYVCVATNRVGRSQRSYRLRYQSVFAKNIVPITMAIIGGVIMLIFTAILIHLAILNSRRNQDLWKLQKELEENEANEFDPTLPIFDRMESGRIAMRPGYPFCLTADKLLIERKNVVQLGFGQFGVVLQVGLKMPGSIKPIALKRPKCNWDVEQYRMLYREICLMTHLGRHPNIVNMIGCVINIVKGQLYMLMELCDVSLQSFLLELSDNVNPNKPGMQSHCRHKEISKRPKTKASRKGYQFHSDLVGYTYQIASGMEYLSKINFVHRDLAARNVLLSNNCEIAKIADFGLSLKISKYLKGAPYNEKDVILPARSTAPEALLKHKFTTASDVWSFGILIGEIFSLGDIPFAHINCVIDAYKLQSGKIRPQKPKYATDTLYDLMLKCCKPAENDRIAFSKAKEKLAEELNLCGPGNSEKLEAKMNELHSNMKKDSSHPTNNSIFYSYQPRAQPNVYTSQNRFNSLIANIPKMGTKNFITVNRTDTGKYVDPAFFHQLTSENNQKSITTRC